MTCRSMPLLVFAGLILAACTTVRPLERTDSAAAAIVQRQLDAYNAHDLASFVATYSDDVVVYRAPATTPAISGKQQLSEFYQHSRFTLPTLHADIVHRSVVGNKVVDHERITGLREAPFEAIVVYIVQGGLIHEAWIF